MYKVTPAAFPQLFPDPISNPSLLISPNPPLIQTTHEPNLLTASLVAVFPISTSLHVEDIGEEVQEEVFFLIVFLS